MKSFEQRVINKLLKDGWNILYNTDIPFIDFFGVRRDRHIKKAYCVKAHRHLSHKVQAALCEYNKQTGTHVVYVHEVANRDLEFVHLYPRNTMKNSVSVKWGTRDPKLQEVET